MFQQNLCGPFLPLQRFFLYKSLLYKLCMNIIAVLELGHQRAGTKIFLIYFFIIILFILLLLFLKKKKNPLYFLALVD